MRPNQKWLTLLGIGETKQTTIKTTISFASFPQKIGHVNSQNLSQDIKTIYMKDGHYFLQFFNSSQCRLLDFFLVT